MYGDAANKENDWAFAYLPKVDREYSWVHIWDDMYQGKVKGLIAFGMNGVAIGPNSQKNIDALKKADWLVVCEIYPDETSGFWKSPGITAEEMKNIKTEVYRLPGAGFAEKDGTFVNSARWLQWKWAARAAARRRQAGSGDSGAHFLEGPRAVPERGRQVSRSDSEPGLELHRSHRIRRFRKSPKNSTAAPWRTSPTKPPVRSSRPASSCRASPSCATTAPPLAATGCGAAPGPKPGALMQRRGTDDPSGLGIYPNWAWSWPMNRRVLYNRASCDLSRQALGSGPPPGLVERSAEEMGRQRCARLQARLGAEGSHGPVHHESGRRRAAVRAAGRDGRRPVPGALRADREPGRESSASAAIQQSGGEEVQDSDMDKYGTPEQGFTMVCTTYRLTEHYHYWTKNNPMNVQLVPEMFVEIPVELADELGIKGGDKVKVTSARATYIAKAMVTRRIRPMTIDGKKVYQIGIPIHQGFRGIQEDAGRAPRIVGELCFRPR